MLRRSDLAALKHRHPLPVVVGRYGVVLRASGRFRMGRCPFHDDQRPSMLVDPDDDHYHCFACGAHGDVVDFVQRMEHVDFRGAVARLADGAPPSVVGGLVGRRRAVLPKGHVVPSRGADERPCLAAAVALYQRQLLAAPHALMYLDRRGLDRATIARHGLGYAAGGTLVPHLRRLGLSPTAAWRAGLLDGAGRERLTGRVVVPEQRSGQPVWLIGRSLALDRRPKYLGLPGRKPVLGWEAAAASPIVVVTEGPFDWLALRQWGFPAVALVGTHASPAVLQALSRFPRVYLALDGDAAGQAASALLLRLLGRRAVAVVLPPDALDVADLAGLPDGRALFARALEGADHLAA